MILLKFGAGGVFLDSESQIYNKIFIRHFDVKVKYLYIAYRKCV